MARADSTIRVNIIGDSKSLQSALSQGEGRLGTFQGKMLALGTGIAATFAAEKILDFTQTALGEADRLGDAIYRLDRQLGPELAAKLDSRATQFERIGASRQDVLELAAAFADSATALGQSKDDIGSWAEKAAGIASAFALIKDTDADTVIKQIGLAAGGAEKPLKELGIALDPVEVTSRALADSGKATADNLTDAELAAARYKIILEKLSPVLDDAASGSADLEQRTKEVGARWETFTGKVGEGIEGPLSDLLGLGIDLIDGLGDVGAALDELGGNFLDLLGPVGTVANAVGDLLGLIQTALENLGILGRQRGVPTFDPGKESGPPGVPSDRNLDRPGNVTVNVSGGNPADVETAVAKAIQGYVSKNGKLTPIY